MLRIHQISNACNFCLAHAVRIAVAAWLAVLAGADVVAEDDADATALKQTAVAEVYVGGDEDLVRALERVSGLEAAEKWADAAAACQAIIDMQMDDQSTAMVPARTDALHGVLYVSAAQEARRRLVFGRAELHEAYRRRYGQAAQAALERALAARDPAGLRDVWRRYTATEHGRIAAAALGDIHFERGEFPLAQQCWNSSTDSPQISPIRAAKLAHCRALAGDAAGAREVLARLPDGTELTIAGRATTIGEIGRTLPQSALRDGVDDWPAVAGNAAGNAMPAQTPDLGRALWHFNPQSAGLARAEAETSSKTHPAPRVHHPVAANGRVYLNTGIQVICIDAATGEEIWQYTADERREGLRDLAGGGMIDGSAFYTMVGGSVTGLDADGGRVLWRTTPATGPIFKPDALISQPVAARGRVFFGLTRTRGEGESFLVALDAADGSLLGSVFLESHVRPRYLGLGALGSPTSLAGNTVIHCTNMGTVAAMDADTLEIRWLWRYPYVQPSVKDHRILESPAERWALNPPAIVGDRVIVAPQDYHWLYALDLHSGAVLWRQPRAGARYFAAPEGAGAVFMFGGRVAAVDMHTGKLRWISDETGDPAGRPVAGRDCLLVPTARTLVRVDPADGSVIGSTAWADPLDAGNLCAAGGSLICGTPTGAAAFEAWETARRRLDTDRPWDLSQLGRLYLDKNQPERALVLLRKAEQLDPDMAHGVKDALRAVFEALAQRITQDETEPLRNLVTARKYCEAPADHVRLLLTLGDMLSRSGRIERAIEAYQTILTDFPDELMMLSAGLEVRAAVRAAIKIEELIARNGTERYAGQEADAAALLKAAAGFVVELERIVRQYPNSIAAIEAVETLVQSRLAVGLPLEAADFVQQAVDELPPRNRPEIVRRCSQRLAQANRPDLAAVFLRQLMAVHPETAEYCTAELERLGMPRLVEQPLMLPLHEQWRSGSRLASARPKLFTSPFECKADTPFGRQQVFFAVHSDRPRLGFAGFFDRLPSSYDYVECRTVRDGHLVWGRTLPQWGGELAFTGGCLLCARPGALAALDALTGEVRWQYKTDSGGADYERIAALAGDDSRAYAATSRGRLVCLNDTDGTLVWQRELEGVFMCSNAMTITGGSLVAFAENPAAMFVIDPVSGAVRRRVPLNFPDARVTRPPVLLDPSGVFVASVSDRYIAAVDTSGAERWRRELGFPDERVVVSPKGEYVVVIPSKYTAAGRLVVLAAGTGATVWEMETVRDSIFGAAVDDRGVYLLERSGRSLRVRAFSLKTGEALFEEVTIEGGDLHNLALHGDYILVSGERAWPRVVLLNRSGREVFAFRPAGSEYLVATVADGMLIVATDRGTYGLGRRDAGAAAVVAAGIDEPSEWTEWLQVARSSEKMTDISAAVDAICKAMAANPPDNDYLRLHDRLSGLRERLHTRRHPVLRCVQMDRPPEIDGILADDWNESTCLRLEGPEYIELLLPSPGPGRSLIAGSDTPQPSVPRGDNDISVKVYAGWDDENFYLAVDVTDRTHRLIDKDREEWIGDLLIIAVDAHNDGGYGYNWGDYILSQGLMGKPKEDEGKEDEPEGEYEVRLKEDHSGVVYESRMPWRNIPEIRARVGARFGFGVTVTDDDGQGVVRCISWTPGLFLHRDPSMLGRTFTPEMLGDVLLTLPTGYRPKEANIPERIEEQE